MLLSLSKEQTVRKGRTQSRWSILIGRTAGPPKQRRQGRPMLFRHGLFFGGNCNVFKNILQVRSDYSSFWYPAVHTLLLRPISGGRCALCSVVSPMLLYICCHCVRSSFPQSLGGNPGSLGFLRQWIPDYYSGMTKKRPSA